MVDDVTDKLAYFQAITGLEDADLCTEILQAHGWDLEIAISSFTSPEPREDASSSGGGGRGLIDDSSAGIFDGTELAPDPGGAGGGGGGPPGVAWRIITLPISIVSGSLGLVSGAIGLGIWAAGVVISYSLGMFGFVSRRGRGGSESSARLVSVSAAAAEAMEFVSSFDRECGVAFKPKFVSEGFMDAL